MLDWAARQTRAVYGERAGDELWTRVSEDDPRLDALLTDLGFVRDPDHALKMSRPLDDPPARPAPPDGWTVREVGGEQEWGERVEIHQEVWHPSRIAHEAYHRLGGRLATTPGSTSSQSPQTVRSAPTASAGSTQ